MAQISSWVVALFLHANTLLSAVTAVGIGIAGVGLVAGWPSLPVSARWLCGLLAAYGVFAFLGAIQSGTPYRDVLHGASIVQQLPFWLRGAFVGAFVILPLALVSQLGAALAHIRTPWQGRQLIACAMTLAIVVSGFTSSAGIPTPVTLAASRAQDVSRPSSTTGQVRDLEDPASFASALGVLEKFGASAGDSADDVETKAGELGTDPQTILAFVRDRIRDEIYEGVLRGARGTLMARAGNAYDKSILLAALLRQSGIDARFARATLAKELASRVVDRMFDAARPAQLGSAPALSDGEPKETAATAAELSRQTIGRWKANLDVLRQTLARDGIRVGENPPTSIDTLIQEAADHVWVEYRSGDHWLALDASLPSAIPGQSPIVPAQVVDELPSSVYQKVAIREQLTQWSSAGLQSREVMRFEANAADLDGAIVRINHGSIKTASGWVSGATLLGPNGAVNGALFDQNGDAPQRDSPAKRLGDQLGQIFGGPAATTPAPATQAHELAAVSLDFDFTLPSGRTETVRRVVLDRLDSRPGVDRPETLPDIPRRNGIPRALDSIFVCSFVTGPVSARQVIRSLEPHLPGLRAAMPVLYATGAQSRQFAQAEFRKIANAYLALPTLLGTTALAVQRLSQQGRSTIDVEGSGAALFYEAMPRLAIASLELNDRGDRKMPQLAVNLDLRRNNVRIVTRAVQGSGAVWMNVARGVLDGAIEHTVAQNLGATVPGQVSVVSTTSVMERAAATNTPVISFQASDRVQAIRASDSVRAHMLDALADKKILVTPDRTLSIGG
ncbi:MAG TPA: transglutaminase family protein, partial [Vicinamibacterales bacterium]|nr:transglutaminase family protein [Vicinamibacterales bacterium]